MTWMVSLLFICHIWYNLNVCMLCWYIVTHVPCGLVIICNLITKIGYLKKNQSIEHNCNTHSHIQKKVALMKKKQLLLLIFYNVSLLPCVHFLGCIIIISYYLYDSYVPSWVLRMLHLFIEHKVTHLIEKFIILIYKYHRIFYNPVLSNLKSHHITFWKLVQIKWSILRFLFCFFSSF